MEVIRECDIFNDDSAEIIEVKEEKPKEENCRDSKWVELFDAEKLNSFWKRSKYGGFWHKKYTWAIFLVSNR